MKREIGYTTPTLAIFKQVCKRFNLHIDSHSFGRYKDRTVVYLNNTYSDISYTTVPAHRVELRSGVDFNEYYECLKEELHIEFITSSS